MLNFINNSIYSKYFLNASILGFATIFNTVCLFVINLVIADILPINEYGSIRTITSYLFVFAMIGTFTFHDALPAQLLKLCYDKYFNIIYSSIISLLSWIIFVIIIIFVFLSISKNNIDYSVVKGLKLLLFFLFFPVIEIVLRSTFQVIGSIKTYSLYLILFGIINLTCIVGGVFFMGFNGWLIGRITSWIIVLIAIVFILLLNIRYFSFEFDSFALLNMINFSKYQMISLILSMLIMSADVICLEYMHGVNEVAYYGIGLMFINASVLVCQVWKRIYFKKIAFSNTKYIAEYLLVNFFSGLIISLIYIIAIPFFVDFFYDKKFSGFESVFYIQCISISFIFIFHSLSAINISQNMSRRSMMISILGASIACTVLPFLIMGYKGLGASFSILLVYSVSSFYGIWLIRKQISESFSYLLNELKKITN